MYQNCSARAVCLDNNGLGYFGEVLYSIERAHRRGRHWLDLVNDLDEIDDKYFPY